LKSATLRIPSNNIGRPPKLRNSNAGTGRIVKLLDDEGFEAARMSWGGMAAEAGINIDVSPRTVRRHIHQEGFPSIRQLNANPLPHMMQERELNSPESPLSTA
jgi:hypothetical protein